MRGKTLEMSLLFDFYGEMLTEKQREVFDLYYNEDLSLAEIAEYTGVTRQGVRDSIKRAEQTLQRMEQKLCLVQRFGAFWRCTEDFAHAIKALVALNANSLHDPALAAVTERLSQLWNQLQSGGYYGI